MARDNTILQGGDRVNAEGVRSKDLDMFCRAAQEMQIVNRLSNANF